LANVPTTNISITADASGYLPAACTAAQITAPEASLQPVTLVSGDINDDKIVDVTDATAVGVTFGQTGTNIGSDINRDEIVDIFDLVLVSINFGQSGLQAWNCLAN
ncbi:MAG TPA: hypothetical protein P5526_03735, partial [Anaerolineae bacterium]|nr:hypothetical protein [Anaerolineae bacterium]